MSMGKNAWMKRAHYYFKLLQQYPKFSRQYEDAMWRCILRAVSGMDRLGER